MFVLMRVMKLRSDRGAQLIDNDCPPWADGGQLDDTEIFFNMFLNWQMKYLLNAKNFVRANKDPARVGEPGDAEKRLLDAVEPSEEV